MEGFLAASKAALTNLSSYQKIRVVLGNRSCDLDSAVCALVQGLVEYLDVKEQSENEIAVIPVMNIVSKEFRIKTEVVYCFKKYAVPINLLTFRDQIDLVHLSSIQKLELILVDHHDLTKEDTLLTDSVIEIIDHRPQNPSWPWTSKRVNLKMVGSCASLVGQNLLLKHPNAMNKEVASLLRGPILIDTSNLSKEADRATPIDFEVIAALEVAGAFPSNRDEAYDEILLAKTDISELTPDDLMIKDLKFTTNGIPIAGFPMLVEDFLAIENAFDAVKNFTVDGGCTLTVLVGLDAKEKHVRRDIAIFSLSDDLLHNEIIDALLSSTEPGLDLKLLKRVQQENYDLHLYKQGNLRATRKHILPIVQNAICGDIHR